MKRFNVVFTGHVDHGKSTIIGRMLYETGSLHDDKLREIEKISNELGHETEFAYVMDHLSEEREEMMTIDTAQIFFCAGEREYAIIDAPGHKELLKNMITGASQADVAVLTIAANEGVMEQTKRHAFILKLLGISRIIVVINKMDLVRYEMTIYEETRRALLDFLDRLGINPIAVIPLSAKTGDNVVYGSKKMNWHKGMTLYETLNAMEPAIEQKRPLRLPIQDIYPWVENGIAAGRLESGEIGVGDFVGIEPGGGSGSVREIRKNSERNERAGAGENIGIIMEKGVNLRRGNVLCDPTRRPIVASQLHANIFWFDAEPFNIDERLTLRMVTGDVKCEIKKIEQRINSSNAEIIEHDATGLYAAEAGRVTISTEAPIVFETFAYLPELGRFVLEKNGHIVAGGTILT